MMTRAFFISLAICIASLYGACSEYMAYDPVADAQAHRDYIEQSARSMAADRTKKQIAEYCGPGDQYTDACNYNAIYNELLPGYRSFVEEKSRPYNTSKGYGFMGGYLFIALIAGWFAYILATDRHTSNDRGASS